MWVGKDGEADDKACYTEYINDMKSYCQCCTPQLVDYILYRTNSIKPYKSSYKILPLKANAKFKISITDCKNMLKCNVKKPFSIYTTDLSDHYPLFGEFIFRTDKSIREKKTKKKKTKKRRK